MPRCYILKKHVNQSKPTVKDKPVLDDGNTTSSWQPKTSNVALKRHDTPISPTEVYASICYNNTLENQSGKCFLKFFIFPFLALFHAKAAITHICVVGWLYLSLISCIIQAHTGCIIVNYSSTMTKLGSNLRRKYLKKTLFKLSFNASYREYYVP